MIYPLSTYKVLMAKAYDKNIGESWVDWAIEMIESGFESENLYMLAGQSAPYDQIELHRLTDKVLRDFNLAYTDKDRVMKDYIYFLISNSIEVPGKYLRTLRELRDIYYDADMTQDYLDFALLYWAKEDLTGNENQWYWPDADRGNIDEILRNKFQEWVRQHENNKKPAQ